jgi:hypothetical protein
MESINDDTNIERHLCVRYKPEISKPVDLNKSRQLSKNLEMRKLLRH